MIPNANLSIQDGALGVTPDSVAGVQVKIGVASKGTVNELVAVSDPNTLQELFGVGPLVEAAALVLAEAGGPVICCKAPASTYGAAGAVAKTGAGTGVLTAAPASITQLMVKITTAGEMGAAKFVYSFDGSTWSLEQLVPADGVFQVPDTLSKISFVGGAPPSFNVGDQWTLNQASNTLTKAGTGSGMLVIASSPVDAYDVQVVITSDGENLAAATGAFKYSLDGGKTFSGEFAIPVSGKFAVPNAGVAISFANGGAGTSFVTGDVHSFSTSAATYSLAELGAAIDACLASTDEFAFIHVVGASDTVANAASMFATLATKMAAAEAAYRYIFAVMEVPQDTDTNTKAAFAALADTRVMVCAGYEDLTSLLDGRQAKRSSAWVAVARASKVEASEDLGRVASGPIRGVTRLHRNEEKTPGLDAARFTTLRTFTGLSGFFLTNGRMFSPQGSDFEFVQHRRVMDIGSKTVRAAMLRYVNDSVRVDSVTGRILEADAQTIEKAIEQQLRAALTQPQLASDVSAVIDRTGNILATKTLRATFRIIPFGYVKQLEGNIGFSNPALTLA